MKTLILGFDAFDPSAFERLSSEGKLPHLSSYAEAGGYGRFAVSNPPQSEVSWTSIATGLNPGAHGIFDFVHRDPATYALSVSLLPTERKLAGIQFVPPFRAHTIFDQAAQQGFPATALWWPATFPARPESPVQTLPGLGTPDIQGRLGVGTLFSTNAELKDETRKIPVEILEQRGKGCYTAQVKGPTRKTRKGADQAAIDLQLDLLGEDTAGLIAGKQRIELRTGMWSPILELSFKLARFLSVRALTRAILTQIRPHIELYLLPLQIHPLHSMWRYATPRSFVKQTWNACGPFLTLGWPQDTTALEEKCITDDQFLDLCQSIFEARKCLLMHHLLNFREGLLASVFDSLDRIQHMFWRDRQDVIEVWYTQLDALLGTVTQQLAQNEGEQTKIIIVSDHGFSDFDHKVHLNRWLVEQGYLVTQGDGEADNLQAADWLQSRAYAVGLNSIYVNLEGREGQGHVGADQYDALLRKLSDDLLAWRGLDGHPVVRRAERQSEAFVGPLAGYGPDIVVGYAPGYRASSQTGLGKWEQTSIEPNRDHWNADHCMDPEVVPGVLFCNQGLVEYPNPSYRDIPPLTIGAEPDAGSSTPPPSFSEEDEDIVEERLRGLGYL